MVAGEVLQELSKTNFEKSSQPLRVLALSKWSVIQVITIFAAII